MTNCIIIDSYGDITMSTLFVNNLNTASGSTITVPTGVITAVTDTYGVKVPGSVIQMSNFATDFTARTVTSSYTEFTTNLRRYYYTKIFN